MANSPKDSERTPWDDAFKQLMRDTLTTLGLEVIEDPKLGKLPLKADLVIISQSDTDGEWRNHPLWHHLSDQNLLEFKSINDPIQPGDFEVLLAYTLLYRVKFKIGYDSKLSSWLVVPYINKHLKHALNHYQIKLNKITSGFYEASTLFPLYVVTYNELPFELPYSTLKLFIKSGKPVQEVFKTVLESEERHDWIQAVLTAMELIHPVDSQEVLKAMGLAAERKELRKTMMELVKDDIDKKIEEQKHHEKLQIASQMKKDGLPIEQICKYTSLSKEEVEKL